MKIFYFIVSGLVFFVHAISFTMPNNYDLDQTDPSSVVGAIFYAAQSGDYAILKKLADPAGEEDGDMRRIVEIARLHAESPDAPQTQKAIEEFRRFFAKGQVVSSTHSEDSEKDLKIAVVNILFGPEGDNTESMQLVERDGKWYLYSF